MTILIVEQGRTIESQRTLIRSLFADSSELSHLKGQLFQKQYADAQAQAKAKAHSQSQTPSTQDKPRDQAKNGSASHKTQKPVPQKPPTDTATSEDERRNVMTI